MIFHRPVMLKEAVEYLNTQKDAWYVDCSLGGGGHTEEILKRGGKVLGIDFDKEAIDWVEKDLNLFILRGSLILVRDNFINIKKIVGEADIKVSGVLFDLGVSSRQLDNPQRGFMFSKEAPLDMRMDQRLTVGAVDLINGLNEGELSELFAKLGEERFAKRLSKKIVEKRAIRKIETTRQLADLVKATVPTQGKIHPATKVFQALRIAVNDELNNLKETLPLAWEVLDKDGRMVIISFHSLEDRIVKEFIKDKQKKGAGTSLTDGPITPSDGEITRNPRSRSAKLRAIKKIN